MGSARGEVSVGVGVGSGSSSGQVGVGSVSISASDRGFYFVEWHGDQPGNEIRNHHRYFVSSGASSLSAIRSRTDLQSSTARGNYSNVSSTVLHVLLQGIGDNRQLWKLRQGELTSRFGMVFK